MCRTIETPTGTMIVCSRGDHARNHGQRCVRCRQRAELLCDAPADPAMTQRFRDEESKGRCSMPLCAKHAYAGPDGTHLCWHHRTEVS